MAAAMSAVCAPVALARSVAIKPATKATKAQPFVSNGTVRKTSAMMVWTPIDNKYFETFSYLPPLTDGEIARQVDYMVANGYTPCLEFAEAANAYVSNESCSRFGGTSGASVTYQDNRYWTMWKLPMFGCQDGNQVLREVSNCTRAFPDAYIRLVAFDSVRQVQVSGFLVHRPASAQEWKKPSARSV